jgi:hypothetical protein
LQLTQFNNPASTSKITRAKTMKKQINPTIKAHLIRSAFYLLLLLGVCAIPFALAQSRSRGTAKPSVAASTSQLPTTSNVGTAAPAPAVTMPALPAGDILYDQINNPAPTPGGVTSQDFEASSDAFDSFAADDFVVPGGETWNITGVDVAGEYSAAGPAASFHVFFYTDSATLPGTLVATRLANPYSNGANAIITLTSPVTLGPGTYWVSVQARQDLSAGQWFWDNRLIISNSGAALAKPGRRLRGLPRLGPQNNVYPDSKRTGPTFPAPRDDRDVLQCRTLRDLKWFRYPSKQSDLPDRSGER